jgi:branched-subunit amino acid ABC-type transport system permease component
MTLAENGDGDGDYGIMSVAMVITAILAMALDPLLLVLAIGAAYALRAKPISAAVIAALVIALLLEALVALLAAADREQYRFGQNLFQRIIAAGAITVGAWALWRAVRKPASEAQSDPGDRP